MIDEVSIRKLNNDIVKYYEVSLDKLFRLSSKTFKLVDKSGRAYFLKETNFNTLEKYLFLENQGIRNVLFPLKNHNNEYVTRNMPKSFYLANFYNDNTIIKEVKLKNLMNELMNLHENTSFKRQLSPMTARPKFEELSTRLDYKYKMLENFVRSVEGKNLNIYSMPILANYQYLLDAKKDLVRLQKRLISSIKAKESIEYSYLHNNPKLDHLLNINGESFLTSIDNSKIGLLSLDYAKMYIENEDLNIDFGELFKDEFSRINPFYYDYFRFMVLNIYIQRLNISSDSYVNAQSFINTSNSIKKYFNYFTDLSESEQ